MIRAGAWVELNRKLLSRRDPRIRGFVERIEGDKALVRWPDGDWPFPYESDVPLAILVPAPAPRFKQA